MEGREGGREEGRKVGRMGGGEGGRQVLTNSLITNFTQNPLKHSVIFEGLPTACCGLSAEYQQAY